MLRLVLLRIRVRYHHHSARTNPAKHVSIEQAGHRRAHHRSDVREGTVVGNLAVIVPFTCVRAEKVRLPWIVALCGNLVRLRVAQSTVDDTKHAEKNGESDERHSADYFNETKLVGRPEVLQAFDHPFFPDRSILRLFFKVSCAHIQRMGRSERSL
ncbi:Uncharacterised protein [Chlamydia trachomatis]|nr:Uncharacterised protein [Chlamydia trachomatis]